MTAASLSIWSVGEDTSNVEVKAGAFGLASGAAATAGTDLTSTVVAGIVDAASAANRSTVTVVGTFDIDATNRLGGSSSIDGKTGGIVSGASANADTTVIFATSVQFGTSSVITATSETGSLKAVVYNGLVQSLTAKLVTGGALSGAGAYVDFTGSNVLGEIVVGQGAQVTSRGELAFEIDGTTSITLQSYSETYGKQRHRHGICTGADRPCGRGIGHGAQCHIGWQHLPLRGGWRSDHRHSDGGQECGTVNAIPRHRVDLRGQSVTDTRTVEKLLSTVWTDL